MASPFNRLAQGRAQGLARNQVDLHAQMIFQKKTQPHIPVKVCGFFKIDQQIHIARIARLVAGHGPKKQQFMNTESLFEFGQKTL
jgi:hypothetical protein